LAKFDDFSLDDILSEYGAKKTKTDDVNVLLSVKSEKPKESPEPVKEAPPPEKVWVKEPSPAVETPPELPPRRTKEPAEESVPITPQKREPTPTHQVEKGYVRPEPPLQRRQAPPIIEEDTPAAPQRREPQPTHQVEKGYVRPEAPKKKIERKQTTPNIPLDRRHDTANLAKSYQTQSLPRRQSGEPTEERPRQHEAPLPGPYYVRPDENKPLRREIQSEDLPRRRIEPPSAEETEDFRRRRDKEEGATERPIQRRPLPQEEQDESPMQAVQQRPPAKMVQPKSLQKREEDEPPIDVAVYQQAYKKQRTEFDRTRKSTIKEQRQISQLEKKEAEQSAKRMETLQKREQLQKQYERTRQVSRKKANIEKRRKDLQKHCKKLNYSRLAAAITLTLLLYLALSAQLIIPMPIFLQYALSPYYHVLAQIVLLCILAFLAIDTLAVGVGSACKGRFTVQTLVSVSLFSSLIHAVTILCLPQFGGYLPFCAISGVSLFISLHTSYKTAQAKLRSLRLVTKQENMFTVHHNPYKMDGQPYLMKEPAASKNEFLIRMFEDAVFAPLIDIYCKILLCLTIVSALVVCLLQNSLPMFFFIQSTLFTLLPSAGLLLCIALPYTKIAKHLAKNNAALGSAEGFARLDEKAGVVVKDTDLFDPSEITLTGYRLFNNCTREEAVSFTASALKAADCSVSDAFLALATEFYIPLRTVDKVKYSEHGGIQCLIEGNQVLVGNTSFVYHMGLKPPGGKNMGNVIYTIINQYICSVFVVDYAPSNESKHLVKQLATTGRKPTLAVRDFNINSTEICKIYGAKPQHFIYPPLKERLTLSEPGNPTECFDGVLLLKDGMPPYASAIEGARRFKKAARINVGFGILSSLLSLLIVLSLLFAGAFSLILPLTYLLYTLLTAIPVWILSLWVSKY